MKITLNFDDKTLDKFRKTAKTTGMSVSEVVEICVKIGQLAEKKYNLQNEIEDTVYELDHVMDGLSKKTKTKIIKLKKELAIDLQQTQNNKTKDKT